PVSATPPGDAGAVALATPHASASSARHEGADGRARLAMSFPAGAPGLTVFVNGEQVVPNGAYAQVDVPSGLVTLEVTAPGRRPINLSTSVQPAASPGIAVPPLDPPSPAPPSAHARDYATERNGFPYEGAAYVALGAGGLALAGGVGLAIHTRYASKELAAGCATTPCPRESGLARYKQLQSEALVANVLLGAGALGIVGGGLLYWLAPADASEGRVSLQASPLPEGGGWLSYARQF